MGEQALAAKVFKVKVNPTLVQQAVVTQLANRRPVIADTKDRSEVRGGGKKPWRQKGTGRARAGSSRSPLWRGGGVVFGPTNDRNFSLNLNKKMNRQALLMALSDRLASHQLVLVDRLTSAEGKTKTLVAVLKKISQAAWPDQKVRSLLLIDSHGEAELKRAGRNLPSFKFITLHNINIVDILGHEKVIMTAAAAQELSARAK